MRRHYLVSYDISNPHRLRRVHRIVRDFGQALQYSVFLAQLSAVQKAELIRRLAKAIHDEEDQVLFFDLGRVKGRFEIELPPHELIGRPLGVATDRSIVV